MFARVAVCLRAVGPGGGMSGIDKTKYINSVLFVFAVGALLNLAIDQQIWKAGHSLGALWLALKNLRPDPQGVSQIWKLVGSGGTLAALYIWAFDTFLWKIPFLQGWLVHFPNLEGTWVGVLTPRTSEMIPSESEIAAGCPNNSAKAIMEKRQVPAWARAKKVLPIHVTIEHKFDKLIFTAVHPNSENHTLGYQLVNLGTSEQTVLYVVYHNEPNDRQKENAAAHEGCCQLKLRNIGHTKSATNTWELTGEYWTNKVRDQKNKDDKGTWGDFRIRYESRKIGEREVDFDLQKRFDV